MVDFKKYIEHLAVENKIEDPDFCMKISKYLVSNNWFGKKPAVIDGKIMIEEDVLSIFSQNVSEYCENYKKDDNEKASYLIKKLQMQMPETAKLLSEYKRNIDSLTLYYLVDFLLYYLSGEIHEATDQEIGELLNDGFDYLPKIYSDALADFINWTSRTTKTVYKNQYYMNQYSSNQDKTCAYDQFEYLQILFYLYNADYIEENDMYVKAAKSKDYVDTWLFLALHFLCALRNTDIVRIPHPILPSDPQNILERVEQGKFADEDARMVLYSVVWHLEAIKLTPNKTQATSGVASIKIHIPESVEVHIGKLFAIAESHFRMQSLPDGPLIRVITKYDQINKYMGEEIGDLFLENDFRCRAANKSYMQMIYLLTDDILGFDNEINVKGYMLAALARSHKSSYGDFAKTTSIYLQDAKMSGYTPEFVAKEMFERGVLSAIPSMLLKMITDGEFDKLSVKNQTKMIQSLNMTPADVERSVNIMQTNMKRSVTIVNSVYQNYSREDILLMLHKIGNGEAVSKTDDCLCLVTAMGKMCPYKDNSNCPSCEYEISTKTTMFLMVNEFKRLQKMYKESDNAVERKRYTAMIKNIIIPSMEEMLEVIEHTYGTKALESLEKIIRRAA